MKLDEVQEYLRRVRTSPFRTTLSIVVLVSAMASIAWITSYVSKSAEQAIEEKGEIEIAATKVGKHKADQVLDVVFRNSTTKDAIMTQVRILAVVEEATSCCCPPIETMTISPDIQVDRLGNSSVGVTDRDGVAVEAKGAIVDNNCSSISVELEIPVTIGLSQRSLNAVRFKIPSSIKVETHEVSAPVPELADRLYPHGEKAVNDRVNQLANDLRKNAPTVFPVDLRNMEIHVAAIIDGKFVFEVPRTPQ
jgi:hypothetical protein